MAQFTQEDIGTKEAAGKATGILLEKVNQVLNGEPALLVFNLGVNLMAIVIGEARASGENELAEELKRFAITAAEASMRAELAKTEEAESE